MSLLEKNIFNSSFNLAEVVMITQNGKSLSSFSVFDK